MEELNFNTSGEKSFYYSNMSLNNNDTHDGNNNDYYLLNQIELWVNWITIAIGLLLIVIVMIAVFFQVKKGQDAPVYVINLLVSDLIQLSCRISSEIYSPSDFFHIMFYAVLVSVGFMVCISCERYLVIAKPLWYRFRRNIKTYVVVCSVVWILPVVYLSLTYATPRPSASNIFLIVFLLLPFPLLIFFVVGTIKALSGALRVPSDEKRRIAAIQIVVLLNYILLYLPIVITYFNIFTDIEFKTFYIIIFVSFLCTCLGPLADTTLYLLSRKSIMDKFLASLCSKICNNLELSNTEYELRSAADAETV